MSGKHFQSASNRHRLLYKPFTTFLGRGPSFGRGIASPATLSYPLLKLLRWYNTTYVMFAVTLLLLVVNSPSALPQRNAILSSVDMAVQILHAMDESIVAKQSAAIVSTHLKRARESGTPFGFGRVSNELVSTTLPVGALGGPSKSLKLLKLT
jgi:hypothetical protein